MQGNHKRLHTAFLMNPKDDAALQETVFQYLERLDPIRLKYAVEPDHIINDTKLYRSPMPTSVRREATLYESTFRYGDLNKETYSSIRKNLMLVYGSESVVQKDIHLFHLTEKKIIRDYLAIPQLEKMFDEDYFNFEWDMHVGVNFTEHRNDYQRDHFVHEIRDMYSMLILLDEYGFFDASFDILRDKTASKISRFAYRKFNNFLMNKSGNYSLLERIRPDLMRSLTSDDNISNEAKKRCSTIEDYAATYFFKYVIYASSMMAALFHDMGYPICHFLNVRNRISEYNPTLYMFTHNDIESFDHIASLLGSSLLFTIVSPAEIKKAMQFDGKKYNHGAYSAIAFLMQFYNSGIIFSLPEEKQCAIEIAAVAIYNHTVSFRITNNKSTENFYQPVFQQNPIAFLLRLCDDLQEWGRRYFEFSHQSDIPFCSKCFTPSVFHHDDENGMVKYSCLCSMKKRSKNSFNSFRNYQFLNRKLYLVTTSDYMYSDYVDVVMSESDSKMKTALRFKINYDYFKLLNITRINPTYAKYRLSELNNLKRLVKNQDFSDFDQMDFDYIYLDYFMTANPLTIKIKILKEYLDLKGIKQQSLFDKDAKSQFVRDVFRIKPIKPSSRVFYTLLENGVLQFYLELLREADATREELQDFIREILEFIKDFQDHRKELHDYKKEFQDLIKKFQDYGMGKLYKEIWVRFYNAIEKHTKDFVEKSGIGSAASEYYRNIMCVLVYETLEQYAKEVGDTISYSIFSSDFYYCQYAPKKDDDMFYQCVEAYCNAENDFNSYRHFDNNMVNPYINYFADLAFFEAMNQDIQSKNLEDFKKPI